MRIAFSSLACPGWTVEQIAGAATRYGYDGIEWRLADGSLLGRRTPDDVWRRIASCGVPAVCLDTSCAFVEGGPKVVDAAVTMSERAAEIGAPLIRVFGGAIPDATSRVDAVATARDGLRAAAERLSDGVDIVVETHDAWCLASDVAELTRGIDRVGVLWDVAHTVRAGESPKQTLDVCGVPRLVHLKDADGDALTHFGDGTVPIAEAVELLRVHGYDGWLSFEWEKLWHPELDEPDVALPRAVAYVRAEAGSRR